MMEFNLPREDRLTLGRGQRKIRRRQTDDWLEMTEESRIWKERDRWWSQILLGKYNQIDLQVGNLYLTVLFIK